MKTFLLSCFFLISTYAFALSPLQKAPLYEHLLEVNARWQFVDMSNQEFLEEVSFPDDIARIQGHLLMVEKVLLSKDEATFTLDQLGHRKGLIRRLADYREAGKFPRNLYHKDRQPYFIDEFGTACAVGHLLQVSGEGAFASRISQEMNVAYLLDMPYAEIGIWAKKHGFSTEELALIQPGYSPEVSWESMGTGANGEVTTLFADEANQRLIIGGDFSVLNGVTCNKVGVYANGSFSALGDGVEGEVYAISVFENKVYVGGIFADGSNIAIWDGQNWSYERFGEGTVNVLYVYDNQLLAGGDFTAGNAESDTLNYVARKQNGSWTQFGNSYGPVYSFEQHLGDLFAGGDFFQSPTPTYVKKLRSNSGSLYWADATHELEKLDNVVRSLVSDGTHLYAGGDCYDGVGNATFCMARMGNSGWERLLNPADFEGGEITIKKLYAHAGSILVAGDYSLAPLVGIYGKGISKFVDYDQPYLEALSTVDSTVNAIASVNGELYAGGAFQKEGNAAVNHLAKTPNITGIGGEEVLSLGFYPNPMINESRTNLESAHLITGIQLYDLSGREVTSRFEIRGDELSIYRGNLGSGLYVVKVLAGTEVLGRAKILVE